MNFQPQFYQVFFNFTSGFDQQILVIRKESKIINVPDILGSSNNFLDKMIESIKINIGKKLTG
jgi:hypothetical protein